MNRFIIKTVLLCFILFFFLKTTGYFDNKGVNTNHNVLRIKNGKLHDDLDILFVGNSYCYSGVNPVFFDSAGLRSYNLGIATAGPDFYEIIVEDYLKETYEMPECIMFMVSPTTFSSKSDNWIDYPIHIYLNQPISNEMITAKYKNYPNYIHLLVNSSAKGFRNIFSIKKDHSSNNDQLDNYKGFVYNNGIFSEDDFLHTKHLYRSLLNDEFDAKKYNHLIQTAHRYKKMGITVIFFEAPTFKLKSFFSTSFLSDYSKYLAEIRKQYFLISNDLELDSSCYRNIDHLNSKGAKIYTSYLINRIYENKVIYNTIKD